MIIFAWIDQNFLIEVCITIILCAGADMLLRWFAFKRVDAIAIEFAFFSFVFCIVRFISLNALNKSPAEFDAVEVNWLIRTVICFAIYLIVSVIHGGLRQTLYDKYSAKVMDASFFDITGTPSSNPDLSSQLRRNALKLLEHSIYLTFTTFSNHPVFLKIRTGKRSIRTSAASLLTEITRTEFSNADFEVGKIMQVLCLALFLLLGILSFVVATIKIGTYAYS